MVVMGELIAAGSGYGVKLVVGQRVPELPAGSCECIVETVIRIVHLIHSERCPQAVFIKAGIMGNKRNPGDVV